MISELKFKENGDWYKVQVSYDESYVDPYEYTDDKDFADYIKYTQENMESCFYCITLFKGNIKTFDWEIEDSLGLIFISYDNKGQRNFQNALDTFLSENNLKTDNLDVNEYGYLYNEN